MTDREKWVSFCHALMEMRHDPDVSEPSRRAFTQLAVEVHTGEVMIFLEKLRNRNLLED